MWLPTHYMESASFLGEIWAILTEFSRHNGFSDVFMGTSRGALYATIVENDKVPLVEKDDE